MSKLNGKCFSACDRGQRNKSDLYCTPSSMTKQILCLEQLVGSILEPCCGKMDIVKELTKTYTDVTYYDISTGTDFLNETRKFDNVFTNPPFSLANEFIIHAKKIVSHKIIMLLPLNYLHGQKRYNDKIFDNLKSVYVFTRYPMLTDKARFDGKYETGMIVYAWYVWYIGWNASADIKWINNNDYILSKKDKACQ